MFIYLQLTCFLGHELNKFLAERGSSLTVVHERFIFLIVKKTIKPMRRVATCEGRQHHILIRGLIDRLINGLIPP